MKTLRGMMNSHEQDEIREAVRRVLKRDEGSQWPIYRTQDDNGLEAHEYEDFAIAVVEELERMPLEVPKFLGSVSPEEEKQ